MKLSPSWKKRRKAAMSVWPGAVLLFGLVLNMAGQTLVGGAAIGHQRTLDLQAQELSISQFSRSEGVLAGFAETDEDLSSAGAELFQTHGGWNDPGRSNWSNWQAPAGGGCDLSVTAFCWQARLGPIDSRAARAGIEHDERSLTVRVISGCFDAPLPAVDAASADLSAICENVSTSQALYRKRSFLQYGLHIGRQQSSPRQQIGVGARNPIIDSSIDFSINNVPFHTNDPSILICTHGLTSNWPQIGQIAEVSISNPPNPRHAGVALGSAFTRITDAFDVLGGNTGPCWPARASRTAALGVPPTGIQVSLSRPLLVVRETVESEAASLTRCSAPSPAPPQWLAPAAVAASRTGITVAAGGVVSLGSLLDGQIVYSPGDLTVTGSPPLNSSITVAAGGSITVDATLVNYGSTSGVLALVAGCDVIIANPLSSAPDARLSTVNPAPLGHHVVMDRVAVLAPQGAMYAAAFRGQPETAGAFPVVAVDGAIATRYIGTFGLHDDTGQISGYDLSLTYPSNLADEAPPWWPDPLGGAWQPVG